MYKKQDIILIQLLRITIDLNQGQEVYIFPDGSRDSLQVINVLFINQGNSFLFKLVRICFITSFLAYYKHLNVSLLLSLINMSGAIRPLQCINILYLEVSGDKVR
jgi:hypothetical protein